MDNISQINPINPYSYNPFIEGGGFQPNQNFGSFTTAKPTEIDQFKQDMQTFSAERSAANPASVNQPNPYVQNQGLYDAINSIGTRELSPKVNCTKEWFA